jgi:acyl-coenzyme A thioesterase PaaI-like protein
MSDLSTLLEQLASTQRQIVAMLQAEYFCDDVDAPPEALGWSETRLRAFFEAGGLEEEQKVVPPPEFASRQSGVCAGRALHPQEIIPLHSATPGRPVTEIAMGPNAPILYRETALRTGIPPLVNGLFAPADPLLHEYERDGYRPFVDHLLHKCKDGGYAFSKADGWVTGEGAAAHGLDLRLFVKPKGEGRMICGALRFSDQARAGIAAADDFIHGGAIMTALDEACAELCKAILFPCCVTRSIEVRVVQKIVASRTYRVVVEIAEEKTPGTQYVVHAKIQPADGGPQTLAWASATCVNVAGVESALLARYPSS